jgi:hypothetical protein
VANGLAFAASGDRRVANTEFGRIVRVPVPPNGSAGAPQFVEDCARLGGATASPISAYFAVFGLC